MAFENCRRRLNIVPFHEPYFMQDLEVYAGFLKSSWTALYHLQFWRYCTISFPCKRLCLQGTAEVSKITKSVRFNLHFIFIEISETANSFVKIRLVLEIKSVFSFIKTRFPWKWGCIKMCRFDTNFTVFKIEICGVPFKRY